LGQGQMSGAYPTPFSSWWTLGVGVMGTLWVLAFAGDPLVKEAPIAAAHWQVQTQRGWAPL
jgi:hypothetical protein